MLIHKRTKEIYSLTRCERGCGIMKAPDVHHCSICKKCIHKMDHHCIFIGNCVGYGTQRNFVLFLIYSISLISFGVCTLTYFKLFKEDELGVQDLSLNFVLAIVRESTWVNREMLAYTGLISRKTLYLNENFVLFHQA